MYIHGEKIVARGNTWSEATTELRAKYNALKKALTKQEE